jgi:hypothetical protein
VIRATCRCVDYSKPTLEMHGAVNASFIIKLSNKVAVFFFRTDCTFARKCLQISEDDKKSCGYLALYLKDKDSRKEAICFLELKGSDFDHAVEQIINTHRYTNAFLKQHLERDQHPFIVQGATICMYGSAPDIRAQKKGRDQLTKIFGSDQYIHIKHGLGNTSYDLGDFMHKLYNFSVR